MTEAELQTLVLQHAKACLDAIRHLAIRDGFERARVYGLIDSVKPNIAYIATEAIISDTPVKMVVL